MIKIKVLSENPGKTLYNLRVRSEGNLMSVIIPKNTPLPVSSRKNFVTIEENQTKIHFSIIIGDNYFARDNIFLGKIRVKGIPPLPLGQFKIDIILIKREILL